MGWHLSGEYFESCSCDVLCPCITSQATAMPTPGYCSFVMGLKIDRGQYEGATLDGLNVAIIGWAEGPMANGNSSGEMYLDSRASTDQRRALEDLLSGKGGGAPAALSAFMPKFLGFKTAPISYTVDGGTRRLSVDGVGKQEVTGLPGMAGETLVLTKTGHPISDDLAVARATSAVFKDEHFTIDNTGKNGHFAAFNWKG